MKNSIIAQVNFCFKGEHFSPSLPLDIDDFASKHDNFASLYRMIATHHQIDTYSYAYEVMEASPLIFHSPKGEIEAFINDTQCNLHAYKRFLKETQCQTVLSQIALNTLAIQDLHHEEHKIIKSALTKAYLAGLKEK